MKIEFESRDTWRKWPDGQGVMFSSALDRRTVRVPREWITDNARTTNERDHDILEIAKEQFDAITAAAERLIEAGIFQDDGSVLIR